MAGYFMNGGGLEESLEIFEKNAKETRVLIEERKKERKAQRLKNNFYVKDVIFNDPATVVYWDDGEKTVVTTKPGDTYDPEKGFAMACAKRLFGNEEDWYIPFHKYLGREEKKVKKGDKNVREDIEVL